MEAIDVSCAVCFAKPDHRCTDGPDGKDLPEGEVHMGRINYAALCVAHPQCAPDYVREKLAKEAADDT